MRLDRISKSRRPTIEKREETGESGTSSGSTGRDGFVDALEVVPGQGLDGRAKHKAGMALPAFELVLLGGADSAADDLEDVGRSASTAVVQAYRNTNDDFGTQVARGASGHWSDEAAIGKVARSDLDGFKQTGKSATGTNGFRETTLLEQDGLAGVQVGGNNDGGDGKVFELTRIKEAMNQRAETVVTGETEARHAPAAEVAKTDFAAFFDDTSEGKLAGVCGPQNAADAAAGDASDGDVLFLENLKDAQVGVTAGETASKSQADAREKGRLV